MEKFPVPPGVEKTIDAPETPVKKNEKKTLWMRVKSSAGWVKNKVLGAVATAVRWTVTAYDVTIGKVVGLAQKYVPGCKHLPSATWWYGVAMVAAAYVTGVLAGFSVTGSIAMAFVGGILGVVLLPVFIVSEPLVIPFMILDIYVLSLAFSVIEAFNLYFGGETVGSAAKSALVPGFA